MADGPGELAGKVNGVIPFLFFDLIARVVPGLVLLFGINCAWDPNTIKFIVAAFVSDESSEQSFLARLAVLLVAGYILGHAISPIVKELDPQKPKVAQKYNDLRSQFPSVIPIVMRIRAEYIMYGGLAVSLGFVLVLALLRQAWEISTHGWQGWWNLATRDQHFEGTVLFWMAVAATWAMLYRNQGTIETFERTVDELHCAAKLSPKEERKESKEEFTWIQRFLVLIKVRPKTGPKEPTDAAPAKPETPPAINQPAGGSASRATHPS